MDFDHRDPSAKTMQVSDLVGKSKSWSRIAEEIAKCDLVCANCHRIRSFERGQHHSARLAEPSPQLTIPMPEGPPGRGPHRAGVRS